MRLDEVEYTWLLLGDLRYAELSVDKIGLLGYFWMIWDVQDSLGYFRKNLFHL